MLTPTLLDVAAITNLKPVGEVFDPTATGDAHRFDFPSKRASLQHYIHDHHLTTSPEVSAEEHISFLTFWLSYYVFCSSSLQVAKKFTPLAIQLHARRDVNLTFLILGNLYDGLRVGTLALKGLQPDHNYSVSGPLWLLQLWLLATFESKMQLHIPGDYEVTVAERGFDGLRLALLKPRDIGVPTKTLFSEVFQMFMTCDEFTPLMTLWPELVHRTTH